VLNFSAPSMGKAFCRRYQIKHLFVTSVPFRNINLSAHLYVK